LSTIQATPWLSSRNRITLSREEILDISYLFLLGGLDTVTASLGCMFAYLAANPVQRRRLVDDPALVPGAVEELLRWDTPVLIVPRASSSRTSPWATSRSRQARS